MGGGEGAVGGEVAGGDEGAGGDDGAGGVRVGEGGVVVLQRPVDMMKQSCLKSSYLSLEMKDQSTYVTLKELYQVASSV